MELPCLLRSASVGAVVRGGVGPGCEGAAGLGFAAGGVRANLATLQDL